MIDSKVPDKEELGDDGNDGEHQDQPQIHHVHILPLLKK